MSEMTEESQETNSQQTKKRKQRVVKNAIIDIDSINVCHGISYSNWIDLVKQKLKEREFALLKVKVNEIEIIVNKEIGNFNGHINRDRNRVFVVGQDIINATLSDLHRIIDKWNGINMSRTKTSISRFRDYFGIAKKWWDQTKKKVFGGIFWLKIFPFIRQFLASMERMDGAYNEGMFFLIIIKELFNGSVKYNNTKKQPLINAGTVLCSVEIHDYLYKLHDTLTIKQWINEQKLSSSTSTTSSSSSSSASKLKKHQNKAKNIVERIQLQLSLITSIKIADQTTSSTATFPIASDGNGQKVEKVYSKMEGCHDKITADNNHRNIAGSMVNNKVNSDHHPSSNGMNEINAFNNNNMRLAMNIPSTSNMRLAMNPNSSTMNNPFLQNQTQHQSQPQQYLQHQTINSLHHYLHLNNNNNNNTNNNNHSNVNLSYSGIHGSSNRVRDIRYGPTTSLPNLQNNIPNIQNIQNINIHYHWNHANTRNQQINLLIPISATQPNQVNANHINANHVNAFVINPMINANHMNTFVVAQTDIAYKPVLFNNTNINNNNHQ